jgi:hypothetical protein
LEVLNVISVWLVPPMI